MSEELIRRALSEIQHDEASEICDPVTHFMREMQRITAERHDEEARKRILTESLKLLVYAYEELLYKRSLKKGHRAAEV
jgi:hypothetical protein